jgi:hypothetical protein
MKNARLKNGVKIAVAIVALLLVSSALMVFANNSGTATVSAQATFNTLSERINPLTGQPCGEPLQYEARAFVK